jgi:multidrug transporter EmrE-like cation transporter
MNAWLLLGIAIALEVAGTTSMVTTHLPTKKQEFYKQVA